MLEMVKDAPKRIKASGVVALPIWKMGFKMDSVQQSGID